jgi:hypothetical protein
LVPAGGAAWPLGDGALLGDALRPCGLRRIIDRLAARLLGVVLHIVFLRDGDCAHGKGGGEQNGFHLSLLRAGTG